MKISKMKRAVKDEAWLTVNTMDNGDMWLGTRTALYKATGLPKIETKDQARAVLDLSKKEMGKIFFQTANYHRSSAMLMDLYDDYEEEMQTGGVNVMAVLTGRAYDCLKCADGELVFYNSEQLMPISDVLKESEYIQIVVRKREDGTKYIGVKDGIELIAAFYPAEVLSDEYIDKLHEFLVMCSEQLEKDKNK